MFLKVGQTHSPWGLKAVGALLLALCQGIGALDLAADDAFFRPGASGYAERPAAVMQDLDYAADFTLEGALAIDANQAGGRWAAVLAKTNLLYDASAGFGLGTNQGQFNSFGQSITAKVADGSQSVILHAGPYQGAIYFVALWQATQRQLTLFVNGTEVSSTANPAIDLAAIANQRPLQLGNTPGYNRPLRRDIYFVRLWNRAVSAAEVSRLWQQWEDSGRAALPSDFDRSGLHSEWLMQALSEAGGGVGQSHIRDSAGANHLELKNGAGLADGQGALQPLFPLPGASAVAKAVELRVGGGGELLGDTYLRPLHYRFQVDEGAAFDSTALKDSGWQPARAAFRPILKPATKYYWRVAVRDAADEPEEAGFGPVWTFNTRAAATWFVRPGVYTGRVLGDDARPETQAEVYGRQDGRDYRNAWNGLRSIVWGSAGVEAGDTLYVCGEHIYRTASSNFVASQAAAVITASGYSWDFPLTIRMDCPDDLGTLWGIFFDERKNSGGARWSGPDENGVYATTDISSAATQLVAGRHIRLSRASAPTWVGQPGAAFSAAGTVYVKPVAGSDPTGRIYSSSLGYRFAISRSSHLNFYRCRFYGNGFGAERRGATISAAPLARHVIFNECDLKYTSISLYRGMHHWTVRNTAIAFAPYGIYVFGQDGPGPDGLVVSSCRIHDIGGPDFYHPDQHAIGVQGGDGYLIENNEIWNTGAAIEFWTAVHPMRNMVVRNNFIRNIHVVPGGTGGGGIIVSGDNTYAAPGLRTGFQIYNNVIMNTGLGATEAWQGSGIGSNNRDAMDVFNNVLYNTKRGLSVGVVGYAPQGRFFNNVIINPPESSNNLLRIAGANEPGGELLVDYNLFYPATGPTDRILVYPQRPHNLNSLFQHPALQQWPPQRLVDYKPRPDSLLVDAGLDPRPLWGAGLPAGADLDLAGRRRPNQSGWDIGAFEYYDEPTPGAPRNLRALP